MATGFAKVARRALRALLMLVLGVLGTVVLAYALLTGTPWGRGVVRDVVLEQANTRFRGELAASEINALGLFGVSLRGIAVSDPSGARVLTAESLDVEVSPLALLRHGEVHVARAALSNARADLADLGLQRGVRAAFTLRQPTPPEPRPAHDTAPPVVIVSSIELDGVAVSMAVPDHGTFAVQELSLRGSFELCGTMRAQLAALRAELLRDGQTVGRIDSAKARWALQGEDTTIGLRGWVAQTRVAIDARSRLPNDPAFETAPLTATVVLDGIDAATLRALGPSVVTTQRANRLQGQTGAELKLSGTLRALNARLALASEAGDLAVTAELLERERLSFHVQSTGVTPSKIWAHTTDKRVAVELEGSARLARAPDTLPFDLTLKSGSLDGSTLPVVRAQGRVEDRGLGDLKINAHGQGVVLALSGDASRKELSLRGSVRARDFDLAGFAAGELDADITAVGPPTAPRVTVALGGKALRYEDFVVDQLVLDAAGGPTQYTVSLQGHAPDGRIELEGRVRLHAGAVQLDAQAHGALRKRAFRLHLRRARIGFGGTFQVERAELEGLGQRAVVHGRYGGSARDQLWLDARLNLAALSEAFKLETALQGRADVQLHARGTVERPRAELKLQGHGMGLDDPVHERPTVDADLAATLDTQTGELTADATLRSGSDFHLSTEVAAHFNARKSPWYRALPAATLEGKLGLEALSTEWLEKWLLTPLPVRGRVAADATFAGTADRPELTLTTRAQLRPLARDESHAITVDVRYADAALDLELSSRDEQGEWLHATAALKHPTPTARPLTAQLAQLAQLAHEARWNASVTLASRELGATPLDALLAAPLDPEIGAIKLSAEMSAHHEPNAEPTAHVAVSASKALRAAGAAQIGTKESVCADLPLELSFNADLVERKLDARATLNSSERPLLQLTANARVALESALRGSGPVAITGTDANLQLSEIELATLPYLCGLAKGRVSGHLDASELFATDPAVNVQVAGTQLSLGAPIGIDIDLRASATPTHADLSVALDHGKTRSTVDARVPIRWLGGSVEVIRDQPLQAHVVLDRLPVIALLPPSFAISRATGYLNGAVRANGTLARPDIHGQVEPEDLALTVTSLAQPLHGITGRIAFSNRHVVVERLVARDSGGTVTLDGSAQLEENSDATATLSIVADGFPLRQQGQVAGEIDAKIDVLARVSEDTTRIEVKLRDASAWLAGGDIRRGISLSEHPDVRDPRADQPLDGDAMPIEGDPPPQPVEIAINAEDSFWVRRQDFAVKLSTKLELTIQEQEVSAVGAIQLHRGYLQLLGQTFDIDDRSKVALDGGSPPDPVLDITASTVNRSSNETVSVHIGGRSSAPQLEFFIDDASATVGEAATAIFGHRSSGGGSDRANGEAKSFVAGMMGGVMAMSARRELGDVVPILMVEPSDEVSASRVRAGFELDKLVPGFLEGVIRGVYMEGIVAGAGEDDGSSSGVQGGVLLELYLPRDLVTSGSYGPGSTWSVDLGWEP